MVSSVQPCIRDTLTHYLVQYYSVHLNEPIGYLFATRCMQAQPVTKGRSSRSLIITCVNTDVCPDNSPEN